jgi:hypothetical protein
VLTPKAVNGRAGERPFVVTAEKVAVIGFYPPEAAAQILDEYAAVGA